MRGTLPYPNLEGILVKDILVVVSVALICGFFFVYLASQVSFARRVRRAKDERARLKKARIAAFEAKRVARLAAIAKATEQAKERERQWKELLESKRRPRHAADLGREFHLDVTICPESQKVSEEPKKQSMLAAFANPSTAACI